MAKHVKLLRFDMFVRQLAVLDYEKREMMLAVAEARRKGMPEVLLNLRPTLEALVAQVPELERHTEGVEPLMKRDGMDGEVGLFRDVEKGRGV